MTVTVSPTETQQWIKTTDRKTGRPLFVAVPSQSVPGKFHLVSSAGCDCKSFAYRQMCHHFRQVQAEAMQARATKPAPSFTRDASIGGAIQAPEAARLRCLADDVWGTDGD
jgi:hypothetical protein